MITAKNVLGMDLLTCCTSPMTGFYRNGCCDSGAEDVGLHLVCAQMTAEFLAFTKAQGNDLSTPIPMFNFPGLKPGDKWCLCVSRWLEALQAGTAPPIILESTHQNTLRYVPLEVLQEHSI
jgi:uncharacterized protein (DUF2237 family)